MTRGYSCAVRRVAVPRRDFTHVSAAGLGRLLAVVLMLCFTLAMAWIGVLLGLGVKTVEVAQQLGFLVIFPLTFLSNAFGSTETLPGVLQPIAEWNPISSLVAATRDLFGNPNP